MANISKIRVRGVDYDIKDQSAGAGTITAVQANGTNVATSGTANIPAASTSAYGVTKLNSSTSSTSTTEAATPSAVKSAYDLANSYKGTVTGLRLMVLQRILQAVLWIWEQLLPRTNHYQTTTPNRRLTARFHHLLLTQ